MRVRPRRRYVESPLTLSTPAQTAPNPSARRCVTQLRPFSEDLQRLPPWKKRPGAGLLQQLPATIPQQTRSARKPCGRRRARFRFVPQRRLDLSIGRLSAPRMRTQFPSSKNRSAKTLS